MSVLIFEKNNNLMYFIRVFYTSKYFLNICDNLYQHLQKIIYPIKKTFGGKKRILGHIFYLIKNLQSAGL